VKPLFLAAAAMILSLSVTPLTAVAQAKAVAAPVDMSQPDFGRKSGRCPGGEIRFFVPGCSGV